MGRAKPIEWNLFVDESGDFADHRDDVIVAGLLIRRDLAGSGTHQVSASLQAALPGLPWPPKASELNRPVLFALTIHLRRSEGTALSVPTSLDLAADALMERLRKQAPADLQRALGALADGNRIPDDALQRLDTIARKSEASYADIRRAAETAVANIARLLKVLSATTPTSHPAAPEAGVLLIPCGETCTGDGYGDSPDNVDTATRRYLRLLEGMFVRVLDVLSRLGGSHQIHLYVLDRGVTETIFGTDKHVWLHTRHVNPAIRRAGLRIGPPGTAVKIQLAAIVPYNDRMDASLVLADFAANRARRALRGPGAPLVAVEKHLHDAIQCPVRSLVLHASYVSASGVAEERIDLARTGAVNLPSAPPESRRWALEQAAEWVKLVQS